MDIQNINSKRLLGMTLRDIHRQDYNDISLDSFRKQFTNSHNSLKKKKIAPLGDSEKSLILELHDKGYTNIDIAKAIKRNDTTVGRFLRSKGRTSNAFVLSDRNKTRIISLYQAGLSGRQIWERYFSDVCCQKTVEQFVRDEGISRRSGVYNSSITSNYFHEINNANKAYLLGYIYADGHITNKNIRLECVADDRELLEYAIKEFSPTSKIHVYNKKGRLMNYCYVGNVDIVHDLNLIGFNSKKQGCNVEIPTLDSRFYPDFVRGLFDGDGTAWVQNEALHISICLDAKPALQIEKILKSAGVLTKPTNNIIDMSKYGSHIHHLRITRKHDVLAFCKYIYYQKDVYKLQRKFTKILHNL